MNARRGWSGVLLGLLIALLLLVGWLSPDQTVAGVVLELLAITGALMVHVVVHEAAHALSALALGMRVPEVALGNGRSGVRVRLGGTTLLVGAMHMGGATHLEPRSPRLLRTRMALVVVAGPVSNLALAGAAYLLPSMRADWALELVWTFAVAGLLCGVFNLLPLRVATPTGRVETDGRVLVTLLTDPKSGARTFAASRVAAAQRHHRDGTAAEDLLDDNVEEGEAVDPVVLGMQGTRRIFTGELDEAVEILREAVALPQDDQSRGVTCNNLAWALLLARPDGWLAEADRYSSEAVLLVPDLGALDSTRGCILVHLGRADEARELLRKVDRTDVPAADLVILDHHLFLAEHSLGHLYGARAALLSLIDNGAEESVIDRARSILRPHEVQHALDSLVGADGTIRWPETRRGDEMSRHLAEIRSALTAFVDEPSPDPRREMLRAALGG